MSEHDEFQPASSKRRAAARVVDTVVTAVWAAVVLMVAGVTAVGVSLYVDGGLGSDRDTSGMWLTLFSLLALVPIAYYEVSTTARWGQTLGKRTLGLRVVVWDEGIAAPAGGAEGVGGWRSVERWAVPHGSGVLAGVVAGVVSAPSIGAYGILVGADAWLVVSTVVHLSALGDPDGRGWHDKAAGTAVVETEPPQPPDRGEAVPRAAARRGVVAIMMAAAAAGGVLAGGVGFVAIEAVRGLGGPGIDKYDEATRQRHRFGQYTGPDGDACWPENRQSGGTVFCDLESIGGLHWDTGDVTVPGLGMRSIHIGSGHMCLLDNNSTPRCWEWSPDVQPRPARVPEGAVFRRRLMGSAGFVCGQPPDYSTVVCWTVGVDSPEYRQATHRFTDGMEWHMERVPYDPPPRFRARQRDTGREETFDAFTGEELSISVEELTRQVREPRLLVTRTTR